MTKPAWFADFENALVSATRETFSHFEVPPNYERTAAVLILFAPNDDDADILIIERAAHLFDHPGQPAFPGGHVEEQDDDLIATALREAKEEIGLDPNTVKVITSLPQLWLPPSQVAVTPIVAWWEEPHELTQIDTNEVANVHRIPIKELVKPENRVTVKGRSGFIGPAFKVNEMVVWGFTGGVVSALIEIAGLAQEWDKSIRHEINLEY
jgi:8-oxo-dGTP pyrophosphatase MutT (NUDIX family)